MSKQRFYSVIVALFLALLVLLSGCAGGAQGQIASDAALNSDFSQILPQITVAEPQSTTPQPVMSNPQVAHEDHSVAESAGSTTSKPVTAAAASSQPQSGGTEPVSAATQSVSANNGTDRTPSTCIISVSCSTILGHLDQLDSAKHALVPTDGWILQPTKVTFTPGESVFDVLQHTLRQEKIHMEYVDTPVYNSAYIEGINNLYEFDVGDLSGWMYKVNGMFPNYGCSLYKVQPGDQIAWVYTCDLGADVGGGKATGGAGAAK